LNNGSGGQEHYNVAQRLELLFGENKITYGSGENLITQIETLTSADFFKTLMKLLNVTLSLRHNNGEKGEKEQDYILSPIKSKEGILFDSRKASSIQPKDADANGAYNIARKGLWVLEQIDKSEELKSLKLAISNKEWLDTSHKMTQKLKDLVIKHPNSFGIWCTLFYFFNFGEIELVITGQKFQDAIEKANSVFLPNKIFQSSNEEKDFPCLLNKKYNQEVAGYICKNNICLFQQNSIENILNCLQEINNYKTILS
jgi:hypothetical protein